MTPINNNTQKSMHVDNVQNKITAQELHHLLAKYNLGQPQRVCKSDEILNIVSNAIDYTKQDWKECEFVFQRSRYAIAWTYWRICMNGEFTDLTVQIEMVDTSNVDFRQKDPECTIL